MGARTGARRAAAGRAADPDPRVARAAVRRGATGWSVSRAAAVDLGPRVVRARDAHGVTRVGGRVAVVAGGLAKAA